MLVNRILYMFHNNSRQPFGVGVIAAGSSEVTATLQEAEPFAARVCCCERHFA